MKLKIIKSSNSFKYNKELPILEDQDNLLIQATELLHKWKNDDGDKFFVLGEIIGVRNSDLKLSNEIDWSVVEKQENTKIIEGRYIVIKKSKKDKISIWTDFFGRVDIYWASDTSSIEITSGISLFSKSINKGGIDQIALSQALTIYGSRPLKKHTLYSEVSRLGVQEKLNINNDIVSITKLQFEPKNVFQKDDKSKLDLYSDIFIEAVRSRASEKQNIVFLSSGWDSTSILATLVQLFGSSKIDCVIGRMRYSNRSGIINQFELDRAEKMAKYFKVRLHIVELDYTKNASEIIKEVSPILNDQQFGAGTGYNHWLLAKGAKEISKPGAVIFAGEISDGAHNLGFSQYFSIYHPASHPFREYSDKMASYLFGPTFLKQLIEGKHEDDPVWKIFKPYHEKTKFNELAKGKDEIIHQLISTFYLSGGRIPLYAKENGKLLTNIGIKKFLNEGEETYLKEFYGKINESNIYSHYLHLYNSFHWQGGTVNTLEHICESFGFKCRLPFLDKSLIDFLSEMPESWGRGLDINNTKYPLKWMLSNRVDYPMHFQEGPHSYLYDVNPTFSHAAEIMYSSSFTKIYKEIFRKKEFMNSMDPDFFDLKYLNKIIDSFLEGEEVSGQALSDLYTIGNFTSIGLI